MKMIKSSINELLQQEVSRKEFLKHIGVAVLGLIGITSMINGLQRSLLPSQTNSDKQQIGGYGASYYGK